MLINKNLKLMNVSFCCFVFNYCRVEAVVVSFYYFKEKNKTF